MKNNFLQEAYGGLREARSKHYCLGLPRQWKVITSTLLLLFTFAIGNMWAAATDMEYTYTFESSAAKVTGPAVDEFFTASAPTQSGSYTVQANSGNLRYKTSTAGAETTVSFVFTAKEALNISAVTLNNMANSDKIKAVKIRHRVNSESWSSDQSTDVPKSSLGNTSVTLPSGGIDLVKDDVFTLQIDLKNTDTGTSNRGWDIHTITIAAEAAGGGPVSCTVTYDGNGKTGGDVPVDANSPYTTGDEVTVLGNTGSLEKTGYEFVGWNTAANGTGTGYAEGETFSVGSSNVTLYAQWAITLSTHTPGTFEKSVGEGGYGASLVTYNERQYETYLFSWANSKWYIGLGGSYVTDNTTPLLPGFAGVSAANTTSTDGWVNINPNGDLSGSNTGPVEEFAVSAATNSTHYAKIQSGKNFTIKVQGYDQFSFGGRENGSGSGKQFVVKINGTVQTIAHSTTDWNMWRFNLSPAKTYTIEVSGDGANDNRFRAFSLRVPECTKPAAPTSLSCTDHKATTLTFGWTKETNATGYVAKLYSDSECETEVDSKNLGDVAIVTFTGLSNSTTYYCKVQSKGNGTTYCEDGNVTAAVSGETDAPSCGVVTPPTFLQAGSITAEGATLLVTDAADAMNYEFYISEESTEPETSATATHTSTTKEKAITGLTSGTTYYVWVRSVCDADHKSIWVALDGDKFKVKAEPTTTFANGIYVLGGSALDLSALIANNNSAGAITYEITDAGTTSASISTAAFSATAMGTATVQATQAAYGDFAEKVMSATITVLDDELSDTYIWSKASKYGGDGKCISGSAANVDPNANAALTSLNYSSLTMENATSMGRPGDNKVVTLTFTATQEGFAIKDICTFGKLEEALGGQIRWDDGEWTALAKYGSGDGEKKTFSAPAGTFPTTFSIRFTSASSSEGGLWWRNALVTLEVIKTVSGTTEDLQNVKINDVAISSSDLETLKSTKTLDIATIYAVAPTVTFVKRTTTNYVGGWPSTYTDTEQEVVATEVASKWSATSSAINAQTYTVTLGKPTEPTLETAATAFTLTSAKIATAEETFTFSGANLGTTDITIALESAVAGMTVSPSVVSPTAGAITDAEVTITYKSLVDVAEANVNLIVSYSETVKLVIPLTYSSTVGYEDLTSISAATTWNWDGAADGAVGMVIDKDQMIILANADATWDENFNARAIAGKLEHMYRDGKYAQGLGLKFNTTIPGKVFVKFSNTSTKEVARAPRITDTNGSYAPTDEADGAKTADAKSYSHAVAAGDVLIEGFEMKEGTPANMLRFYEVRFAPVYSVTYDAGEGAVKGGETMPTQADEAAGEKIILAAATALEKDGYDFAGWLCNIDAQTYQPGDEYTMTAAATTFTAQWVLHVDPVDPTLTYNEGAYTTGGAALDLSSLITAQTSTGAITYSVKDAGTTGATIDGKNFTATAAGTATITASQAAILGYNAITVDFEVVVTEATEIDGIKLVEAGALTGNFITGSTLSDAEYTIEGIHYEKYLKFGSSFSGSYGSGARTNYIFYDLKKENTTFYVYAHNNTSTAGKIIVYTYNTASAKYAEVPVAASENAIKSFSLNDIDANTRVFIGVDNNNIYFCQVVAVESGADLMKAGEIGYEIDFSAKSRFSAASGTAIDLDGMEFVTSSGYTPNSSTEVGLGTLGTNYVKLKLDVRTLVEVKTNSANQYYIGSTYAAEEATSKTYEYKPAAAGETHAFDLEAGTWYLNPNTSNIKLLKLTFTAPKCAEPSFDLLANSDLCEGDAFVALNGTATVADAGTVSYKWYAEGADESDPAAVLGTDATYTPSADGKYYVIATNSLSGYSDNVKKSDLVSVTHFASAAITTAPENVRMDAGQNATLTVVASGKNLSYEWFTCDDEMGTNPVAIVPAETNASLAVTVTAGMNQYYKVVVSSDCGDASAIALVEEWHELPQVPVSATTTWDWQYAATTKIAPEKDVEILMANIKDGVKKMTNDETFNSQALLFKGQEAYIVENSRAFAKGGHIKFTTTVPGKVTVEFSDNGDNNRKLKINDAISTESSSSKTDVKTFSAVVPAGEVVLMGVKNDGTGTDQYIRISKIIFDTNPDLADADYTRNVTEGRFGTICLPNGGVMVGAELFEIAYKDLSQNKIFFDQIVNGEMIAGRPYVFLPKVGATQLGVFYTDAVNADAGNYRGLYGSYDQAPITANEGNYILLNNQYCEVVTTAEPVYVGANRAYIKLGEIPTTATAPAPGRRRISMGVQSQNAATGMDELNASETPVKMLIDGQLFILRGEKMYNANGQLVK